MKLSRTLLLILSFLASPLMALQTMELFPEDVQVIGNSSANSKFKYEISKEDTTKLTLMHFFC